MKTKQIVMTAALLALCVIFQSMKGFSAYLTGTAVNTFLIMAALLVGTGSSLFLAVLTPFVAYLMGATPIMQMIPLMIPTVMAGNVALSLCAAAGRRGKLPVWLAAGAALKAGVLWILVWYVVLPFFGAGVPEPMRLAVKTAFSVTQLITAAAGGAVACVLYGRLRNVLRSE